MKKERRPGYVSDLCPERPAVSVSHARHTYNCVLCCFVFAGDNGDLIDLLCQCFMPHPLITVFCAALCLQVRTVT